MHLGEDLPAEICVNIEVADGLTNGAPCTIKKLDYRVLGSTRCSIVWVQFCSQDIGKKCRSQFKHLFNSTISSSWTPILEITRKFNFNYYHFFGKSMLNNNNNNNILDYKVIKDAYINI